MIQYQSFFQRVPFFKLVQEPFYVFYSFQILIKLLHAFAGGVIIIFHGKKQEVFLRQWLFVLHSYSTATSPAVSSNLILNL